MNDTVRQDILLCNKLNQIGKHNFCSLKIPTNCKWNLTLLEDLLRDYEDKKIINYLRYGFPISQFEKKGSSEISNNWPGAQINQSSLIKYFRMESENEAVLGPFTSNPSGHEAFFSPLNTRDKNDSLEKRIIIDMSFPKGNSINNGIKKDKYLDKIINLTYPTVDSLVSIVRKKGCGCLLFKRDLRRFYRQIPVCPKDYSKLGCCFNGKMYFDKVLVMGGRSSCFIAQSITNAFKFILQKRKVDCENYLDGDAEIPDLAWEAFKKMGALLEELHSVLHNLKF